MINGILRTNNEAYEAMKLLASFICSFHMVLYKIDISFSSITVTTHFDILVLLAVSAYL